jgi:hypothetical protein
MSRRATRLLWLGLVERWDRWRFERDAHRLLANPALRWSERIGPEAIAEEIEHVASDAREWRAIADQLDEIKGLRLFKREEWIGEQTGGCSALPEARSHSPGREPPRQR